MDGWIANEIRGVDFGDARLNRRLGLVVEALAASPASSIPEACGSWKAAKGAYRFMDSERVTPEAIRTGSHAATLERIAGLAQVLVLQDTTNVDFTKHPATEGVGPLDSPYRQGLKVHSSLAVSLDGVPLGLIAQHVWARNAEERGKAKDRRKRFTQDKESQRWLDAAMISQEVVPPEVAVITVADREADMYDLFVQARRPGSELLIRATHNRRVAHSEAQYLWEAVGQAPICGELVVDVGRRPDQPPRTAALEVRFTEVVVQPPHNARQRSKLRPVTVRLVLVTEPNPPSGVAGIRWLLLTTLAIDSYDAAVQVVKWYSYRWLIERYHFTLKSGCRLEELQLRTAPRLERALAVMCLVAWRLMWLTYEARRDPEQPCTVALEPHEWEALWARMHNTDDVPPEPPPLGQAVRWIAQLGGFQGRKSDGQPGLKTLWRGWRRLHDSAVIWQITHQDQFPPQQGYG